MQIVRTAHIRQLMALLFLAVMVLINLAKGLHTHKSWCAGHNCHQENVIIKDDGSHACSICEFQLAKDGIVPDHAVPVILPVFASPTYSGLLTNLNSEYFFFKESRGPPAT